MIIIIIVVVTAVVVMVIIDTCTFFHAIKIHVHFLLMLAILSEICSLISKDFIVHHKPAAIILKFDIRLTLSFDFPFYETHRENGIRSLSEGRVDGYCST